MKLSRFKDIISQISKETHMGWFLCVFIYFRENRKRSQAIPRVRIIIILFLTQILIILSKKEKKKPQSFFLFF